MDGSHNQSVTRNGDVLVPIYYMPATMMQIISHQFHGQKKFHLWAGVVLVSEGGIKAGWASSKDNG